MPHPLEGRSDCLLCHGTTGTNPYPADHGGRSNEICTACHQAPEAPPGTPGPAETPTPPGERIIERSLEEERGYCLMCHGQPGLSKTMADGRDISLYVGEELLEASAHRYTRCTTCHGSEPHAIVSPLTKLSLAEKCGSCHQEEYELHLGSVHGQQLLLGNPDVATCADCHSPDGTPHGIMRVLEYDAPTYRKNIAETCAKCHGDEDLMKRYGILEKVYESYMRSFHGKAMQLASYELGQLNKATCTNCHGTHDIKNPNDPDSPVAGLENLARTCEECHPGAGVEFASGFLGHKETSPESSAVAYYMEQFLTILTYSVVAVAVSVVAIAGTSWTFRRWKD